MERRAGASDLIPGIAASVAFLTVFFLHIVPLPVTILLGIAVYFGVKLLLPAPQALEPVERHEPTTAILSDLLQLSQQVPAGSVRVRLRNIGDISESLLRYGDAHPDKAGESLFVLRQYLGSLRTGVSRYLETLRVAPDSAMRSQETLLELLETAHGSLKHLHLELVEKETSDLTGDLRALNKTLQELDKVWVDMGDKTQ